MADRKDFFRQIATQYRQLAVVKSSSEAHEVPTRDDGALQPVAGAMSFIATRDFLLEFEIEPMTLTARR